MNNRQDGNMPTEADTAPFTQDETIVRKIGGTTYILTAKYKPDAKEGLADKLLRLIKNNDDIY